MNKNPVYGFEKPYLENIKKEITVYANEVYFDSFDNLIAVKNGIKDNSKTVVIAAYISENSFLVTDITDSGDAKAVSLFPASDSITNERIVAGTKTGVISKDANEYVFDFGCDNKKNAERFVKNGDALYIKPYLDNGVSCIFSNEQAFIMKNILTTLIKNEYDYKTVFCFIREKEKGAYALGKNLKSDFAFFISASPDIKNDISLLKKEKNYISEYKSDKLPMHICETSISGADPYYLAGGCNIACGISLKSKNFDNGTIKITKKSLDTLEEFFKKGEF